MRRLTAFLWIGILLFLFFLFSWLSQPTTEILYSFTLTDEQPEEFTWLLELLAKYDLPATFFLYGEYAQQYPTLVQELATQHEIGCLTLHEVRLPELNVTTMQEEIRGCKEIVEELTGKTVLGFRAPHNLIDERTYRILEEEGFNYDASSYENYGWFYPRASIPTIPTSTLVMLPLQDSILVEWLLLNDFAFFVMRQDHDERLAFNLHPRLLNEHRQAFTYLFGSYLEQNVTFLSYSQAAN